MAVGIVDQYPAVADYLDDTEEYQVSATEVVNNSGRFLVVTQRGVADPDDPQETSNGQQYWFKWSGDSLEYWENDTIVDASAVSVLFPIQPNAFAMALATCGSSSEEDHEKVINYVKSQVNKFDSSDGPDGGNLACVWTVRHLVKAAIGRWITKTDGTAVFGEELHSCFGSSEDPDDVLPGGIIISPTRNILGSKKRNVGHVGFLGEGSGGNRLIYSNSSAAARLKQNFTVSSWTQKYKNKKGLSVLFYPLPNRTGPAVG